MLRDVSAQVIAAATTYGRDDWRYIATQGKEGVAPAGSPSRFFPWAGQLISRSGWDADAHWSFFDVGPWGVSHQHNDMLHLSVHAFGRDLLVDGGRFAYQGKIAEKYRDAYAFHSRGHNVILVDGLGQCSYTKEAKKPCEMASVQPDFDFARGSFTAGYTGKPQNSATAWNKATIPPEKQQQIAATHTRAVVYLRGLGWLVADQVTSDQARTLTALWHFHPSCTVVTEGSDVASVDRDQGNLRITPIGEVDWKVQVIKGQEKPVPQGWYSKTYNMVEVSPCAEYTAEVAPGEVFGWLMIPGKGEAPRVKVERLPAPSGILHVKLTPPDAQPIEVAVRLSGEEPIPLSGGLSVEGNCAVLMPGQPPRAGERPAAKE